MGCHGRTRLDEARRGGELGEASHEIVHHQPLDVRPVVVLIGHDDHRAVPQLAWTCGAFLQAEDELDVAHLFIGGEFRSVDASVDELPSEREDAVSLAPNHRHSRDGCSGRAVAFGQDERALSRTRRAREHRSLVVGHLHLLTPRPIGATQLCFVLTHRLALSERRHLAVRRPPERRRGHRRLEPPSRHLARETVLRLRFKLGLVHRRHHHHVHKLLHARSRQRLHLLAHGVGDLVHDVVDVRPAIARLAAVHERQLRVARGRR